MAHPGARSKIRAGIVATGVLLAASATACSSSDTATHPTSASTTPSTRPTAQATLMIGGHSHTITSGVSCVTSTSQLEATPPESGNETTRIHAQDGSASVMVSVSDESPPSVNSFSLSLKSGGGRYQMDEQPVQTATQVQATRQDKSFTVSGIGQATEPGQEEPHAAQFGIHVICP